MNNLIEASSLMALWKQTLIFRRQSINTFSFPADFYHMFGRVENLFLKILKCIEHMVVKLIMKNYCAAPLFRLINHRLTTDIHVF